MIKVFTQIEKFLLLIKDFSIENPFYTEAFFSNYFKQNPKKKYTFLEVTDNNEVIGLVPLELVKKFPGLEIYDFIAHRKANYHGYICNSKDVNKVHQEVKQYFRKRSFATKIEYYDINSETQMYKCLSNDQDITNKIELYECPAIVLGNDFNDYFLQQVKESKKRTEIRKFVKKLNAIGSLSLINIDESYQYELNKEYINQIFLIHKERFDEVYTPSHFSDIGLREYYLSLIKDTISSNTGYLSLLVLDNTVISFIYCLRNNNLLVDWIPAFDPAFTKYNLGTAHYYMLIETLFKEGWCKYFDFSKGDSVYKRRWANTATKNYSFDLIINNNVASKIVDFIDYKKNYLKTELRKKGVLKKIKRTMGKVVKENAGDNTKIPIVIKRTEENIEEHFSYSIIRNCDVKEREELLNYLYNGKKINLIENGGNIIVAEVEA